MRDVLRQMRPDRFEDLIAARRAVPSRPDGQHPRLLPAQARRDVGGAAPGDSRHPGRDLRHHGLPGTGDADRAAHGAATAWAAPTCCAARWARRSAPRWRRSARSSSTAPSSAASTPAKAAEVFDLMAKFADYGFNKSHAAAYALVAYQTAWMKANHPVAFLAACMSLAHQQHRPAGGAEAGSGAHGHPRCCRPTSTAPAPISRVERDDDGRARRSATRWRR